MYTSGPTAALALAEPAKAKFRDRHPLYYLLVLSGLAWAERRAFGGHTPETARELVAFNTPALAGWRAWETAEGFLG